MRTLSFKIVGVSPLLMHNGQLADPMNKWSRLMKEISAKRKKVDADFEELARLEWYGGLYLVNSQIVIPGYVFEACLIGKGGAARKERMGKEAAAALWVLDDMPLIYDGPTDLAELWADEDFRLVMGVKVGQARVMRTRPMFKTWSAEPTVTFDPDLLNEDVVRRWVELAGAQCGLCDWRPRFGRFDVEW